MPVKKNSAVDSRESEKECCRGHRGEHGLFWPIAMIIVGLVWLARNMGWLDHDVPWFPLLLIGFGVYLIVKHNSRQAEKRENP
jgi:hypothetical protein